MKNLIAVAILVVAASFTAFHNIQESRAQANQPSAYFGWLTGTTRIAGVAIDIMPADASGQRVIRAYVCDGLGMPEGMAVWFLGTLEAATPDGSLTFMSVSGNEKLVITAMNERGVYGAFIDSQNATAHFAAYPSIDGAGIYQVTLDEALRYRGTSTMGATLDAQASPDGTTTGTIRLPSGQELGFTVKSLALAAPAALSEHGLPQDFRRFTEVNQIPGEYTAVIAPGGGHWLGRSGSVRDGTPGANIIGLDKKERGPRTGATR